jgi:hypothetical protein
MSSPEIAIGYHIERIITMTFYSCVFTLTIAQLAAWLHVTKCQLKHYHYISAIPVLLDSLGSFIVHIDFRTVYGIWSWKTVTIFVLFLANTIIVGFMFQFLRMVKVNLPGENKNSYQLILSEKVLWFQEFIFILCSVASYVFVLEYRTMSYFSIVWFGLSSIGVWATLVVLRTIHLLKEMEKSASSIEEADKYAEKVAKLLRSIPLWLSLTVLIFTFAVLIAVEGTSPYESLFHIKDPAKFQISTISFISPANFVACTCSLYFFHFVPEGCIWTKMQPKPAKVKSSKR